MQGFLPSFRGGGKIFKHKYRRTYIRKKLRNYGGLGHHYGGEGGCGYVNFSVKIVDQVEEGDKIAQRSVLAKRNE